MFLRASVIISRYGSSITSLRKRMILDLRFKLFARRHIPHGHCSTCKAKSVGGYVDQLRQDVRLLGDWSTEIARPIQTGLWIGRHFHDPGQAALPFPNKRTKQLFILETMIREILQRSIGISLGHRAYETRAGSIAMQQRRCLMTLHPMLSCSQQKLFILPNCLAHSASHNI